MSLAQFDYIHCAESVAPLSGFEPWPQDVKLVRTNALTTRPNWTFNILSKAVQIILFCAFSFIFRKLKNEGMNEKKGKSLQLRWGFVVIHSHLVGFCGSVAM